MIKAFVSIMLLTISLPVSAVIVTNNSPDPIILYKFELERNDISLNSITIHPGETQNTRTDISSFIISLLKNFEIEYEYKSLPNNDPDRVILKYLTNNTHISFFSLDKIESNEDTADIYRIK